MKKLILFLPFIFIAALLYAFRPVAPITNTVSTIYTVTLNGITIYSAPDSAGIMPPSVTSMFTTVQGAGAAHILQIKDVITTTTLQ